MLGFAMRAGKVVVGTDLVIGAVKAKGKSKAELVLISEGASEGTKNKIRFKAEFYRVKALIIDLTPEEMGQTLGKESAPVCLAVTDCNFAKEIVKALDKTEP